VRIFLITGCSTQAVMIFTRPSPTALDGRDEVQPDVSFLYGRLDRPVYGTEFVLA
jgi:hypothetical protein